MERLPPGPVPEERLDAGAVAGTSPVGPLGPSLWSLGPRPADTRATRPETVSLFNQRPPAVRTAQTAAQTQLHRVDHPATRPVLGRGRKEDTAGTRARNPRASSCTRLQNEGSLTNHTLMKGSKSDKLSGKAERREGKDRGGYTFNGLAG